MLSEAFHTPDGVAVPAVTAAEMRDVDRVAVETVGLTLPRMMEHAGRTLARQALDARPAAADAPVVVLAGAGGNGGGGLVCARHLTNRGIPTRVVLDREPGAVTGVPGEQLAILEHTDAAVTAGDEPPTPSLVVDALLGYGLSGAPRGEAARLIEWTGEREVPVISLDLPSGVDATTGDTPGVAARPELTLTLALPKTGLVGRAEELVLADLSIPGSVYGRLDLPAVAPFGDGFRVELID